VIGTGALSADHRVWVDDGSELVGRHVVLASGSLPRIIPGFEIDGQVVMSSDEVLDLQSLPASAVVIGGGAVGCEFASMMADLGTQVTVLELLPSLIPGCDAEVSGAVARSFKKRGIDVRTGVKVHGHQPNGQGTTVSFGDGEKVTVDAVVLSVGRRPDSERLVDPDAGVELDEGGFVRVDEHMRTTADGVYAVGDVVPTAQLAHVGFAEAIVAIKDILGEPVVPVDYSAVPWCIYTHPEVAFAGLSEAAARDAGYDVVVKKYPYGGNSRAKIVGETEGLVKVIAERGSDGRAGRLLGVHMVGPWVTEQLGQGYLTVNWEATADEAAQFIQPHPTLSEAFGETVLAMTGRGLHVG
jgi:dihydrolipoamide dehydrogenase